MRKVFIAILVAFIMSCVNNVKTKTHLKEYLAEITCYLTVPENTREDINITIEKVELINSEGNPIVVLNRSVKINSIKLKDKQLFLGDFYIPPGNYKEMVIYFSNLELKSRKQKVELKNNVLRLKLNLKAKKNVNRTLFLVWDTEGSIIDDSFIPEIYVNQPKESPAYNRLMYVLNTGSDNVTVVDRFLEKAINTIRVGLFPADIARGSGDNSTKLYVANSGSNTVSVINMETNTVEREIRITTGEMPVSVELIRLNPSVELLFVANYRSNNVTIINTQGYMEIGKIEVGSGPYKIARDPSYQEIINSTFIDRQYMDLIREYYSNYRTLFVANRNSNTLSVIRINIHTREIKNIGDIKVEWEPVNMYTDPVSAKLYVASYDANNIAVIDLIEVMKGNMDLAKSVISGIGYSVVDVISEPAMERLYILKDNPPIMDILRSAFQGGIGDSMPTLLGQIVLEGQPKRVLISPEGSLLYIIEKTRGIVYVVNKLSYRIVKEIQVGTMPTDAIIISNETT